MADGQGVFVGQFAPVVSRLPNRLKLHRHDYFEVFFLEGKAQHSNDFCNYEIDEPTLILVSPGQVHTWIEGQRLNGPMVCFTQEFFDGEIPPPSPLLRHRFWYPDGLPPVLPVAENERGHLLSLFTEMEREFKAGKPRFEEVINALLRVLFIQIDRLYEPLLTNVITDRSSSMVREFRLAVEQNFRTMTAVGDYAKLLKISADHLGEAVKVKTGHTAGEMIRNRLLLEAQRLLVHTPLAVSEIAYELNFQDPAYFSRFFRRLTSQSPGEFRDANASDV